MPAQRHAAQKEIKLSDEFLAGSSRHQKFCTVDKTRGMFMTQLFPFYLKPEHTSQQLSEQPASEAALVPNTEMVYLHWELF